MSLAPVLVLVLYLCGQAYPEPSSVVVAAQCTYTDEGSCTVLTDALEQLNSMTTLHLATGTHRITQYLNISGLRDITITGNGSDVTEVTCDDGVGLAFVNMTGLTLSGFTLNRCGLTGEPIAAIMDQIEREILMPFDVPEAVRYALVLWGCLDVTLSHFLITNTNGLGLLGINVLEVSMFQVNFTYNRRPKCILTPPRYPFRVDNDTYSQIGGGAYFIYQDYMDEVSWEGTYTLMINKSNFRSNSECSFSAITQVNFQQFSPLDPNGHMVGGGGGLTVFMTQRTYNVDLFVMDSVFANNSARYGGGVHVSVFAGVQSTVMFKGCRFEWNGIEDTKLMVGGAGLAIFVDAISQRYLNEPIAVPEYGTPVIEVNITDTNFTSNLARVEGGGFFAYSLANTPQMVIFKSVHFFFINCVFVNNSALYGAAAFLQQNTNDGSSGNLVLHLSDVTFNANKAGMATINFTFEEDTLGVTSAVALRKIFVKFFNRVECSDNKGSGMHLHSSPVYLNSESQFLVERNTAQQGGGAYISGKGAGFGFETHITFSFQNNTAILQGGAIYVSPSVVSNDVLRPIDGATGCVIGPVPTNGCFIDDKNCFNGSLDDVSILFAGNSAPSGSVMYGSTLEPCTWTRDLRNRYTDQSVFHILFDEFEMIHIDREPNSPDVVSTLPARISITGQDNTSILNIIPGQSVNVSVKVYDHFNNVIPDTVTAHIINSTAAASIVPISGSGEFFFFSDIGAHDTMLTIEGLEDDNFQVHFLVLSTLVAMNLPISTSKCLQGFTFENRTCLCNQSLLDRNVQCNLNDLTLTAPDGIWVGSLAENNASTQDLVVAPCLKYCRSGDKEITLLSSPDYDSQCKEGSNRAGVLCGGCLPDHSVVLGDTECRECSHWSLLLVPVFAVIGVLVFLSVAFLELTIDNGWMYAILFFSNLLVIVSPRLPPMMRAISVPAHLLSLELGIGICFYDGMTALERVLVKLIFPFYLLLLMLVFTLVTKKVTVSRHYSPVKTFVTLGMMFYTSVLSTCSEIIAADILYTVGGERHIRWGTDPNVVYCSGLHGFLFFLAIVIIVIYLIPTPLILLSPYIAYRYFKKLIPVLDACWAPYKSHFRWWLGARLLVRLVLFFSYNVLNLLLSPYSNIICTLVLLILIEFELSARPFKMEWVNILDSILIGDIVALIIGMFLDADGYVEIAYFAVTVFCGYLIICGVLFHHSRTFRIWRILKQCFSAKKMKTTHTHTEVAIETLAESQEQSGVVVTPPESTDPPPQRPPRAHPSYSSVQMYNIQDYFDHAPNRADFSHLRESLLESQ